ncbi:MAG: 3-methylornithyl-N6-L-lysine dehydrogenase PylD [Thermoleophilia bacterium]
MTRLTADDVGMVAESLPALDRALLRATGADLLTLALMTACGPEPDDPSAYMPGMEVEVVPITAGAGTISGFTEAVAAVCAHIGCHTHVSTRTDVAGLAFAAERGAELVLLADDERFIAFNLFTGSFVDNGLATGHAYAMALHGAAGGVAGREVLVIGLGPVGLAACATLARLGATVLVCDTDLVRVEVATRSLPVLPVPSVKIGLESVDLVLDASPAPALVRDEWVTARSVVAAPGLPSGVAAGAAAALGYRLIHEPLALGVAAMVVQSCLGIWTDCETPPRRPRRVRFRPEVRTRGPFRSRS